MKKLLSLLGIGLLLASCTDDYKDWAEPQSNPQEEGRNVSLGVTNAPAIDFQAIDDQLSAQYPEDEAAKEAAFKALKVPAFVPSVLALDEFTAKYSAVIYNAERTKNYTVYADELDESGAALVNAADIRSAFEYLYGKNGDPHQAPIEVTAIIDVAGQAMKATNETTITATLVAPEFNEYIYMAGNANGWGNPADVLRSPDVSGFYLGFMYIDGEFKFRSHKDNWDAPDWGMGEYDGELLAQGANINSDGAYEAGFYMVEVDMANMFYSLMPISSIGIIGPATAGGWDYDEDLVYNTETHAWEGTFELNADEYKFRANDDWTTNWGGNLDDLTFNGANLKLTEAGTYFIQLFITYEGDFHATVTKQ